MFECVLNPVKIIKYIVQLCQTSKDIFLDTIESLKQF